MYHSSRSHLSFFDVFWICPNHLYFSSALMFSMQLFPLYFDFFRTPFFLFSQVRVQKNFYIVLNQVKKWLNFVMIRFSYVIFQWTANQALTCVLNVTWSYFHLSFEKEAKWAEVACHLSERVPVTFLTRIKRLFERQGFKVLS